VSTSCTRVSFSLQILKCFGRAYPEPSVPSSIKRLKRSAPVTPPVVTRRAAAYAPPFFLNRHRLPDQPLVTEQAAARSTPQTTTFRLLLAGNLREPCPLILWLALTIVSIAPSATGTLSTVMDRTSKFLLRLLRPSFRELRKRSAAHLLLGSYRLPSVCRADLFLSVGSCLSLPKRRRRQILTTRPLVPARHS